MLSRITVALLALTTFIVPSAVQAGEIKTSDLATINYTYGSLANPHVIRIGEPQARAGRVAALERIYDVAGAATRKQSELKLADKLFKKYGDDIPFSELVSLMTAERTLFSARKFKQRLHVWDAQQPKKSFVVELTPVFDAQEPQIVNPEWVLEPTRIVIAQQSSDGYSTRFYTIDLKTKKLRTAPQITELPDYNSTDDQFEFVENGETVSHEILDESNDDGSYRNERFTISNARTGVTSSVLYPFDEFVAGDSAAGEILNPLVLTLGSAGHYLKGYTAGALLVRQGILSPTNVMENAIPEDTSRVGVKAEIVRKWGAVRDLDFATYQVIGYRLHR